MDQPTSTFATYAGEELVSANSYLRRLPIALVLKERMRFDAIVTASDIIGQAINSLRQFTAEVGIDLGKFSNGGRAFALSQCWTLVDQLHAVRQLLKPPRGKEPGPFAKTFLDAALPATNLRNVMDHLAGNLDNLSQLKGSKLPLFGSLSYFYSPAPSPIGGNIVTIMSGALHGNDLMPCINPCGRDITLPTGLFTLSASEHELEFGHAIGALRDWIRMVESKIEGDVRAQVAKRTKSEDEIEAAMATLGGGLAFVVQFDFIEDAQTAEPGDDIIHEGGE